MCFMIKLYLLFSFLLNLLGLHWLTKLYRYRCTVPQHILCTLYCVFTAPSQASFHHQLSPDPPPPTPTPISPWPSPRCCVHEFFLFIFFFSQSLYIPHSQLSACSLSVSWSLFYLLVQVVY